MRNAVVVAGQPGSGNCLIRDMLEACGASPAYVLHNGDAARSEKNIAPLRSADRVEMIIPVRHPEYSNKSRKRRRQMSTPGWEKQLELARELGVTPYFVSYEALVSDAETIGRHIIEHCGLPQPDVIPWPTPVYDANEKYKKVGSW